MKQRETSSSIECPSRDRGRRSQCPKLTADAELKFSPDVNDCHFKSSVDFGVVGEIGAKLKAWKWELADWQTEVKFGEGYNIFHCNFPHEEGDEANGSFDNVLRLLNPYKNL